MIPKHYSCKKNLRYLISAAITTFGNSNKRSPLKFKLPKILTLIFLQDKMSSNFLSRCDKRENNSLVTANF